MAIQLVLLWLIRTPNKPNIFRSSVGICAHLCPEIVSDRDNPDCLPRDMMENDRLGLRDVVIDGLEYLDRRTEFWRQQQPIYSRKRDKYLRNIKNPVTVPCGPSIRKGGKEGDQSEYVLQNLEEIENALNDMRLEQGLEQVIRAVEWNHGYPS